MIREDCNKLYQISKNINFFLIEAEARSRSLVEERWFDWLLVSDRLCLPRPDNIYFSFAGSSCRKRSRDVLFTSCIPHPIMYKHDNINSMRNIRLEWICRFLNEKNDESLVSYCIHNFHLTYYRNYALFENHLHLNLIFTRCNMIMSKDINYRVVKICINRFN